MVLLGNNRKGSSQGQYLTSAVSGLTSQSSWLLGLAGPSPSWKLSRVDTMSWTCRFSSLISCHSWGAEELEKPEAASGRGAAAKASPAATAAARRRPAACRRAS